MDYRQFPLSSNVIDNRHGGGGNALMQYLMAMPVMTRGALTTLWGLGNSRNRYVQLASQDLPSLPLTQQSNVLRKAAYGGG